MGQEITIGGERLGSGKKMKAYMHGYERSTHDLSYIRRFTAAPGTVIPFLNEIALPGDTFDISLQCDILTKPTTGPLFGSFKVEQHVFTIPLRLYQQALQMNLLDIGREMNLIKIPQIELESNATNYEYPLDNQQINPSSLYAYLGIRGLGQVLPPATTLKRQFNASSILAYWDIYKQYLANKQEGIGVVIHKQLAETDATIDGANAYDVQEGGFRAMNVTPPPTYVPEDGFTMTHDTYWIIFVLGADVGFDPGNIRVQLKFTDTGVIETREIYEIFYNGSLDPSTGKFTLTVPKELFRGRRMEIGLIYYVDNTPPSTDQAPQLTQFPLINIDAMRRSLMDFNNRGATYVINGGSAVPYRLPLQNVVDTETGRNLYSMMYSQEGLAIKTYSSDLFNNWIDTEWIDGADGISAVTAVSTAGDKFTIDELNLKQKIYNMLNRIALSGGTYDDWQDATYDYARQRMISSPVYIGGLIKELVFQEVISSTPTEEKPLGTLAGRGRMGAKHKGGDITVKIDEPSIIMGLSFITPRLDYSQGNKWDVNLTNMDDLHKPALDEIGFQDLITDQMAWWDTTMSADGTTRTYKSAGKQPAWINYMTNVNTALGNFADESESFMVLIRRYEPDFSTETTQSIKDLTTYIDPKKFNHIFADTRIDAQNFWVQIGVKMEARRKMSAKVIPNL